ncbi:uncharacterized protein LOC125074347 [Vanessa atalanta]|uniref:uncharacterized protein LOC125074347 n=1 Tax=Vanessa atalanta TaxID=42275 RepID=UPI001FCCD013|nr:uncharacterized protein LOC125074347 [Vanessa atalanta]
MMLSCIFILTLTIISVQSQRVAPSSGRHVYPNTDALAATEPSIPKKAEAAVPNTILPVIPFITELPTCPDLCFDDILKSPLGCLDPILDVYGKTTAMPGTDMPGGPPIASRVARLALSSTLPGCDCRNHFLDRLSIPPPFI